VVSGYLAQSRLVMHPNFVCGWTEVVQCGGSSSRVVPALDPFEEARTCKRRMMMHVDIEVEDLDAAVADAVGFGATVASFQPRKNVRVLLDPAGHPFCHYVDNSD
jgi:Glyoxalase-like domain